MDSFTRSYPRTISSYRERGFTLLEVVVVIAIALLALTAVYVSLYYGGKSSARTRVNILKKQELMKQFFQMRRKLTNLYHDTDGASLLGEKGTRERTDAIYFLTSSLEKYRTVGEVGYRIERDYRGNSYLAYTEFPYPRQDNRFAAANPQDEWKPASRLIKKMKVEYESANQWSDEWKSDQLPQKIRITFWYRENDGDEELTPFSFIVAPGASSVF